jgi:flavin reductase (DIM6/NTAB) family NADH-FMN oxidoreductase RutF
MGGDLVLGEVLRYHLSKEVVEDFRVDHNQLRPVGRMAGLSYVRCGDRFDLARPVVEP